MTKVIKKTGFDTQDEKLKKKSIKLLLEIYWKFKMEYGGKEGGQNQLKDIEEFLWKAKQKWKNLNAFENRVKIFLEKNLNIPSLKQQME